MIRKAAGALVATALVLAGAALVSKDVRRFFTLYADGSSDALKGIDLAYLSETERAAYLFAQGDFGALSTDTLRGSATPWKLTATVLTLDYVNGDRAQLNQDSLDAAFRRWGITHPEEIANWPSGLPQPQLNAPLGITVGTVERSVPSIEVTAANIGCALCHSSVTYDAQGVPDPDRVWIGAPNGSINLEAYPQAIYDAFVKYGEAPDLLDMAQQLFPEMSETERKTLRNFVLPRAVKRIAELQATTGRAVPFKGGLPGLTNGLDALQIRLGLTDRDTPVKVSAFNSIPNLEDHALRSSFLNAATYEIAGTAPAADMRPDDVTATHLDQLGAIVAYFTVPSMGIDLETAREQIPAAQTVMRFVATYESPPFPGPVDKAAAQDGAGLYAAHCASCHGTYETGPDGPRMAVFPNHVSDIGTDPLRLSLLTERFAAAVNGSEMGKSIFVPVPRGYSAPSLSGVWASAPYLHNGSVPSIWALMNSEARPVSFPVGGHKLDFDTLGLALDVDENGVATYPEGYVPWSEPVTFDTRQPGLSSAGHEAPFDTLSDAEKRALLEYLKTL